MTEERSRCGWAGSDPLYIEYHDKEWGVPVYDDRKLFEFLALESFQAGLSWLTVLKKRENFRIAFDDFDYRVIADYDEKKINELLADSGIIRNRLKILAIINNAAAFLEVQKQYGSFSDYIWAFTGGKPMINHFKCNHEVPASTALSDTISKDLKMKGFKFTGSTIIYAHLQATGMVNDHLISCFRHKELS
ncbi:MAG: DNA-3-methyladenine glycosylase I [Bacteroidales bacterium]|nr:DNA-3-methyladenine glycosylase I [Bacteroidales bacterium]